MDENFDFQGAVDKIREMFSGEDGQAQLNEIMGMFHDEPKSENNQNSGGFDPSMLLKMQKIMSLAGNNEANDKAKLLMSLKPFLKGERQNKVDKAVQLMNMSKILTLFKDDL